MIRTVAAPYGQECQHIEMTAEEIAARQAEESAAIASMVAAHLPNYRFKKENGGINVNGTPVQTDRETRASLLGARTIAKEDANYTVTWKTDNGFAVLNAVQIIAIADAVASHVRKCFVAEAAVTPNLGSMTTVAEVETAFNTAYEAA